MPSIEQLHRLLALDPGDAFVLYALAQEHAKRAEPALAIEHFDRCIAADPAYAYAYFHKARVQEASGDAPGARETLERGLAAARAAGDAHAASEIASFLAGLNL